MKTTTSKKIRTSSPTSVNKKNRSSRIQDEKQIFKALNDFVKMNDWNSISEQLTPEDMSDPGYHLMFRGLATAYLGKGDSDTAFNLISGAFKSSPECIDCRWLLGCVMMTRGESQEAINIWISILDQSEDHLSAHACEPCCEGEEKINCVRSVVADSKYMLSQAYESTGDFVRARTFRDQFAEDVRRGAVSNYSVGNLIDN